MSFSLILLINKFLKQNKKSAPITSWLALESIKSLIDNTSFKDFAPYVWILSLEIYELNQYFAGTAVAILSDWNCTQREIIYETREEADMVQKEGKTTSDLLHIFADFFTTAFFVYF